MQSVLGLGEEIRKEGGGSVLREFATQYPDQLPSKHEVDVVSTFQLSWRVVPEAAKPILRVMGELAPVAVPKDLLRRILNLPPQTALRDPLNRGIEDLVRLSL